MLPNSCEGPDPCCDSLFEIVDTLREVAFLAVKACGVEAECKDLVTFVSVGEPVYAAGNYVAAWIETVGPGYRAPSERGANIVIPRLVARIGVALVESGWPTIEGGFDGTVPDPQSIHDAARYSHAHGEKMARAVYREILTNHRCNSFDIQPMRPYVDGQLAGWSIFVDTGWDL